MRCPRPLLELPVAGGPHLGGAARAEAQMEPSMCELAHVATDFIPRSNAAEPILDRSLEAAAGERVMAIA
jgi:hypothetical protein